MNDRDKNDSAPNGEELAKEINELQEVDADPSNGRGEPGDGTAGASGPGGNAS